MARAAKDACQPGKLLALLVEDNPLDAELVVRELERDGFEVSSDVAQTEEQFKQRITARRYDVILADYSLPQWRGMEALEIVRKQGLDIPVILVTGSLGDVNAVECIKRGVTDYVLKDKLARLPASVRRAIRERCLRQQHKQAEEALRQSQGQLEAIIQTAMDAIITIDEQQRIVLFNIAAERMFGYSAADARGQSLDRFIPSRFRSAHGNQIRAFGLSHTTRRKMDALGVLYGLRADGSEFPAEISISQLELKGSKLYTAIVRDITERKRSEEELARKAADLARSNRDLEQFAYVASHDLQEPLRMVASYTQLLAERYRGKLDENADKYIAYAIEGALRMQALIQDLLAFSRVGRDASGCQPTDCNAVFDEAQQNLQVAIQESHASITHDPLPVVTADRSQLVQLFQNLIGNAIKFRGTEPPAISVSAEQQAGGWTFAVSDNGIGIAPEHREVIFVIFQRLHTRVEYSGNGVGLAICKKIVEQHGGRIWVDSGVGRGSIFRFTLPAIPADEKENNHETCS